MRLNRRRTPVGFASCAIGISGGRRSNACSANRTKSAFGSTRREVAVYDAIVEAVAHGEPRLLAPLELNRVLRGLQSPQFFSVGNRPT